MGDGLHKKIPHLGNAGRGIHRAGGGQMDEPLKAPFPYFGGKSRAAHFIWPRFGDVPNYVEPFFGSGAVLLARPTAPRIETVNDVDALLCNFWRSIKLSPEETARHADGPVDEADLHSKHRWLVSRKAEIKALILSDPEAHDPKVAGWWVWGLCAWIGSGWCAAEPGGETVTQMDHLGNRGRGVHRPALSQQLPHLSGGGVDETAIQNYGRGIHSKTMRGPSEQLPHLADGGRRVHRRNPSQQIPAVDTAGMGIHSPVARTRILDTFERLAARLRGVRVACGDFERVLSDSVTWRHGTTAILLDPPYADGEEVYSAGDDACGTFARAAAWAAEHGSDRRLRVILCGYEGTWTPPDGWETVAWKARGGYGAQRADGSNENAKRERLWCSPGCLRADATENAGPLFATVPR